MRHHELSDLNINSLLRVLKGRDFAILIAKISHKGLILIHREVMHTLKAIRDTNHHHYVYSPRDLDGFSCIKI